ncbi:MAG: hypothetical protein ABI822_33800 [Bryobacteraceae bacterium]
MLECTADTSIPSTDGHSPELRLPQAILLNFRFAAVRDWAVIKATLLLHVSGGDPLRALDIATIPAAWDEKSTGSVDARGLLFLSHKVEAKPEGWISIAVEPSLVELLTAGKGTGLAVRDRSTSRRHAIHSRESVQFSPYLVVEGRPR